MYTLMVVMTIGRQPIKEIQVILLPCDLIFMVNTIYLSIFIHLNYSKLLIVVKKQEPLLEGGYDGEDSLLNIESMDGCFGEMLLQ